MGRVKHVSHQSDCSLTYLLGRVSLHLRLGLQQCGALPWCLRLRLDLCLLGRLRLRCLLLKALAVHGDAAIAVQLLAFRRRRLVGRGGSVVGRLLVLLAAVPPARSGSPETRRDCVSLGSEMDRYCMEYKYVSIDMWNVSM